MIQNRKQKELGASLVEYALLLALIAVVGIPAITTVGVESSNIFTKVENEVAFGGINPLPFE